MKVLVTGGAGFIGANFVYHMLEKYPDYRIICVDKLTYAGNIETLDEAMKNENFVFYKVDITDKAGVEEVFEKETPDVVVNFAAESHVDRSIEDPGIFLKTNILGTQVLMDASIKYGVKRYHQVSTDEVYGDLPLDRPDSYSYIKSLFCIKSISRPSCYGISQNIWFACNNFKMLKQLRTLSVP